MIQYTRSSIKFEGTVAIDMAYHQRIEHTACDTKRSPSFLSDHALSSDHQTHRWQRHWPAASEPWRTCARPVSK